MSTDHMTELEFIASKFNMPKHKVSGPPKKWSESPESKIEDAEGVYQIYSPRLKAYSTKNILAIWQRYDLEDPSTGWYSTGFFSPLYYCRCLYRIKPEVT